MFVNGNFTKDQKDGLAFLMKKVSVLWKKARKLRFEKEMTYEQIGDELEISKARVSQNNLQLFAMLAEKLLIESGVSILYGTYAVGTELCGDKIVNIITESKSGRLAYKVKTVVDATGDCDIAKIANAPTDTFKQGNILAAWYYSLGNEGYRLNMLGYTDVSDEEKTKENAV